MEKGAFEDRFLVRELEKLMAIYQIEKIVETGTYMGWSANILARTGKPVISIELNPDLYEKAKENNKHNENVFLHLGSSEKILDEVIPDNTDENILFFLDAHWNDYWPILDELRIIKKKTRSPVIIIHDFFVPNGTGGAVFGYDSYKGQPLDFNYVQKEISEIYGENQCIHYCLDIAEINAGVGIFLPTKETKK